MWRGCGRNLYNRNIETLEDAEIACVTGVF